MNCQAPLPAPTPSNEIEVLVVFRFTLERSERSSLLIDRAQALLRNAAFRAALAQDWPIGVSAPRVRSTQTLGGPLPPSSGPSPTSAPRAPADMTSPPPFADDDPMLPATGPGTMRTLRWFLVVLAALVLAGAAADFWRTW